MANFKVLHNDGRTRAITADEWNSDGTNWVFTVGKKKIAVITQKSVESITDEDVPDPEAPEAAEVEVIEMERPRRGHGFP